MSTWVELSGVLLCNIINAGLSFHNQKKLYLDIDCKEYIKKMHGEQCT